MTDTFQTLVDQLHGGDPHARSQAALQLGQSGDERALNVLMEMLASEPDELLREDVTWAVVRFGESAVPPLIALLDHTSADVRHNATHALGKLADARAADALCRLLDSEDNKTVRLKTLVALGQIGDARAVPSVARLIGSGDVDVVANVNIVMARFAAAAHAPTVAALTNERWQVREHAAELLGILGDDVAVPALVSTLHDAHWQVRFAAANALGEIGSAEALAGLSAAANDADARVRQIAIRFTQRG